ncbi:hypothetical protein EAS64_37520 [Trebonia kvetii]|uniref:Uncharacterized protein n=1 Tax=Trebonia kvetii TaxID=2480626 RepID=A0A6P2BPB0_9ACTN|nr:hypothetical protein EAS64_37520 [Trebonia kvetii]
MSSRSTMTASAAPSNSAPAGAVPEPGPAGTVPAAAGSGAADSPSGLASAAWTWTLRIARDWMNRPPASCTWSSV